MNERIRLLAEQARKHFPKTETSGEFWVFDEQKFAELIVRECVQSIEKTIETNCDNGYEKMGCEFAITDMLEHFGVEE